VASPNEEEIMASTPSTAIGPVAGRTALTGVRVFDGQRLTEPRTVVIDGAVIGSDSSGAREIDAAGAVLLPGLIDAHIHLHGRDTLRQLVSHGVTTGLDMATWPRELLDSLRGVSGEISPVCVVKRRFKCREGREIPHERIA
jgi:hypothetical protein